MILGFTGTRHGMTERQRFAVSEFLFEQRPTETHSGDCKGADSQFLDAALLCNGNFPPKTHGHPCDIEKWRANRRYDVLNRPKPPLARNLDIVDASEHLLAAPNEMRPTPKSGTWATVRMAHRAKKDVTIIYPDGTKHAQGYTSLAEIFGA